MLKKVWNRSSEEHQAVRAKLLKLYKTTPIPDEEILTNFGLYTRSPALASILFMNEMYQKILDIPGIIMEFGVWWGSNLAIFNNLRAVYEPYNYTRRVIGFDTFEGYPDVMKEQDKNSAWLTKGNYSVSKNYTKYLEEVLMYHEEENFMKQKRKFELVKGDISKTLPKFLKDHPETVISLVYFDLGLYKPTKDSLKAILPYLTKGSILVFDELNCVDIPGETVAVREVIGLNKYKIQRSKYTPDRSYMIIE